jgi:hypothetical protein
MVAEKYTKLSAVQLSQLEKRLMPHWMRIEDVGGLPTYVVEAWQWAGFLEVDRNIVRILMGEMPTVLTATGVAAVQPPQAPMNPAVAAAMGR